MVCRALGVVLGETTLLWAGLVPSYGVAPTRLLIISSDPGGFWDFSGEFWGVFLF